MVEKSDLANPGGEQFNSVHQGKIRQGDKRTKDSGGDEDDNRRVAQFNLGGPRGLLQLGQGLLVKEADAGKRIFHGTVKMAGEEGLEPTTYGFGDRCSTN